MDRQLLLVIDQGTHATRALVFDAEGIVVTAARQPIALKRLSADRIEQDAQEIISSMHHVVGAVLAHQEVRRRGIAQAGLATQRSSVVAWDKESGAALAPLLSWQDRRADVWLSQFADREREIKERTGIPLSPHYGASKLRWLLENVSAVQGAQRAGRLALGPLASYLLFHLLRERPLLTDHANAGRTLLWNIDSGDWDPWLLALFDVPRELLPHCRPIIDDYGLLQAGDIALTAVNGDQNAAVYSLGQPEPGTAMINLGTGAFVLLPTGTKRVPHTRLLSGLAGSDARDREYTIEGTVNGAGAALKWAASTWQIKDINSQLPGWLDQIQDPPLFLNSIGGLGSPFWQPGPTPRIVGQGRPAQNAVAVAESILFLLQLNLEQIAAAGLAVNKIRISGGLANLDGLCRRLADLTGKQLYRPAQTEATARGAAWLAAGRPSHWPEEQPGVTFNPRPNEGLSERYHRFVAALASSLS
ncbi:MAG: FGGY family carbohydrate kinase [Candidatus Promineifilaceae bacterium]|nr:FGGY family carbohydrate kinase [Candidatus Promineifilaceae bacterium]